MSEIKPNKTKNKFKPVENFKYEPNLSYLSSCFVFSGLSIANWNWKNG